MRIAILCACIAMVLVGSSACGGGTAEEKLVKQAFEAIRQDDWDTYNRTTITSADIMMQQNEIGPFQAQQSYLGSSVRPRERQAQRQQFDRAQRSQLANVNLRTARFVALSGEAQHFDYALLTGGSVPVTSYGLRVDVDGTEVEMAEPRFVVVKWHEQPRLLALSFAHERAQP